MDLNLIWCWLTMAFRVSPLAFANAQKVGDFSTFYGKATSWWCAGLTASGEITRT